MELFNFFIFNYYNKIFLNNVENEDCSEFNFNFKYLQFEMGNI